MKQALEGAAASPYQLFTIVKIRRESRYRGGRMTGLKWQSDAVSAADQVISAAEPGVVGGVPLQREFIGLMRACHQMEFTG